MGEPSHLGREQVETSALLKRITEAGVRVRYYLTDSEAVMDTALGKIVSALSSFTAEAEREAARARTYDALARKAKAGHVPGGLVYGYANHRVEAGHVERRILEPEAAAIRRIFELYASGAGLRAIARTLTAEAVSPPIPRQRDRLPGWGPAAL